MERADVTVLGEEQVLPGIGDQHRFVCAQGVADDGLGESPRGSTRRLIGRKALVPASDDGDVIIPYGEEEASLGPGALENDAHQPINQFAKIALAREAGKSLFEGDEFRLLYDSGGHLPIMGRLHRLACRGGPEDFPVCGPQPVGFGRSPVFLIKAARTVEMDLGILSKVPLQVKRGGQFACEGGIEFVAMAQGEANGLFVVGHGLHLAPLQSISLRAGQT